ncbi:MAG: ABC transporter permease [Alphaproteobacteria bacterium]|nr:ABC transporter permease [Alphaproteobacteria bacterium]
MRLLIFIALKHLLARKRQSIVSLLGIILGVAFFLAIASLMRGSEKDFIKRLVDNSPHITISDEFRNPRRQPALLLYPHGAVEIRRVKPVTEIRGIRGYEQILKQIRPMNGVIASPMLAGQALVSFAGKDLGVTLNGMIPAEIRNVSTIEKYMIDGTIDDLLANPDGIVIGQELARKLALVKGENITVSSTAGQSRTFKILGIFRTGRANYDSGQAFVSLKRVQALLNRPNRINSIVVKLQDPYQARQVAADIESRIGYKSLSWQEASEDLMNTLIIRNTIMYTVVSAVLIVAAFGIYNVISTVVMEKLRDISILKSMGFYARDIRRIFLIQGILLGLVGTLIGLPLGSAIMSGMMQIRFKPPGATEIIQMPIDWGWLQFAIASAFAMTASILAALLPARKAAHVQPVDILRGGS